MNVLDAIVYCSSAAAIIALPFLLVNWTKYIRSRPANKFRPSTPPNRLPVKSTLFFVAPILVAIGVAEIMASRSRTEAVNFIQSLSGNYRVSVNNQAIPNPDAIVSALRLVSPELAHHSHPTRRIRVDIQGDKGSLTLELARDSDVPNEYWVFYPKYRVTSNNEIGRITTHVLDAY